MRRQANVGGAPGDAAAVVRCVALESICRLAKSLSPLSAIPAQEVTANVERR